MAKSGKKINSLHIYHSNFTHESRMLKESQSLVESRVVDRVYVCGIKENSTREHEWIGEKREAWRVPLKTKVIFKGRGALHNVAKLLEWNARILFRYCGQRIAVVQSHSVTCLVTGVLLKLLGGSKLVYDCHELETEKAGSRGLLQSVEKFVEALLIHFADSVIVVSDKIAEWYRDRYNLRNVVVIKNVPYRSLGQRVRGTILRDVFHIAKDKIIFIYVGLMSKYRGVELLLNVFSKIGESKHIVFMGYGELEKLVREYEKRFANIHFHSAVALNQVVQYTSSADVGISLIEGICLSYRYCLPNKLYEYLLSGLPVIVSDLPEQAKLIDCWECGWKVPHEEKAVAELVGNLCKEDIFEKRKLVIASQGKFGWEDEEAKLIDVYKKLICEAGG